MLTQKQIDAPNIERRKGLLVSQWQSRNGYTGKSRKSGWTWKVVAVALVAGWLLSVFYCFPIAR